MNDLLAILRCVVTTLTIWLIPGAAFAQASGASAPANAPAPPQADLSPLDIAFKRQAVKRLVFDPRSSIPLHGMDPSGVVDLELEFPPRRPGAVYRLESGRLTVSAPRQADAAMWFGGFNPFATYDLDVHQVQGTGVQAGVEFSDAEHANRVSVAAEFDGNHCVAVRWQVTRHGERVHAKRQALDHPVAAPFTFRVQMLGSGLNVWAQKDRTLHLLTTADTSKWLDLRRKEHIRSFESRLLTRLDAGDRVVINQIRGALTCGVGQADIRPITYEDGSPYLDRGRLWLTMTVRGRKLPHPLQGVFSLDPSVFDPKLEGIVVFDRQDGLLRNEVASHLVFDRSANAWRGLTVGFSSYGDPDPQVPKQIWAVESARDPRFGFSVMRAKAVVIPEASEDPHMIFDTQAQRWRVLTCATGKVGFPAALYESAAWDGPYQRIAGPVSVNSTGCILQKFGPRYYALFGSSDQTFYVYDYPSLQPRGALDLDLPPWADDRGSRCWPAVIPLPEGYPAPYIAVTMDRANYPGLKGWTYGALYLYHGFPTTGPRRAYEYADPD